MNKTFLRVSFLVFMATISVDSYAQFNLRRALGGAAKVAQAATLTDKQMAEYVGEYIDSMDKNNHVLEESNPYTIRLRKLTKGLDNVDGVPLNFEVYNVTEVNAFACPDGSIRVFSSLMDIMSDDELLGIIGHEIGHIANTDSKDAYRRALLTSALKDGIASAGDRAAKLTDSQLGSLSEAIATASYSKKQEHEADEYAYKFLKDKGRNPWAMAMSFERLKKMSADAGAQKSSKINQLFSTHPDLDDRIKNMEKKAKKDGFEKPTSN